MIFEAHSDDAVIGMGGTIILLSRRYNIILVTMTGGGTAYTRPEDKDKMVEIREKESLAADKILGISPENHIFLREPCQNLRNNIENYHKVVGLIRKYKPVRIYTHKAPSKHRDHRAAHDLVTEAWWKASENVLADLGFPYRAPELYYFEVTDLFEFPHIIVDIGGVFDRKMKALDAFASQFDVLPGIREYVAGLAAVRGYQGGFTYGEAFKISDFLPKPVTLR